MPPPNLTALTAINIPAFPVTLVQDVVEAGVTYTVWYKFTAPAGVQVMGAWGFGGNVGSGYQPTIRPYDGPAAAPVTILGIAAQNVPIQFPVEDGEEYFLEFVKNGDFTPSSLTINMEIAPDDAVPAGSIFINDDAPGHPAAALSSVDGDDYNVLKFFNDYPAGEQGDVLATTGRIIIHDDFESPYRFKLYSNQVEFIQDIIGFDGTGAGSARLRACQGASIFYAGYAGIGLVTAKVRTISNLGVLGSTEYDLGAAGMTALAARNDETVLYYSGIGSSVNSAIARWDLTLDVAMANLVADIGGTYEVTDILYLANDTLIVLYWQAADGDIIIRNINSTTGATISSYALGNAFDTTILPRLAYAINDPISFWVFLHPDGADLGKDFIRNITVSGGATAAEVIGVQYEGGAYQAAETATPLARFGNSFSCPLLILRNASSNLNSGIYIIEPTKTYDELYTEDVEIPQPTIKTAFFGD